MKKKFKQTEIGEIPENWCVKKLAEFCDVLMGQSPPSLTYNLTGDGVPFFQGRKDFGVKYPQKTMWCSAPTRMANDGDVLLSVRAPVGDVNVAVEKCCIGRGLSALSMKNGNKEFLYYLIQHNRQRLKQIFESEGTVFGCVNKDGLKSFEVLLPDSDLEQRAIAKIFSDLDGKIELNHQMNKTLESIAQAIFKRWFVDFEFPNAQGKPYKSSGGKMVDSELGEIPEGWEVKSLRNIISELESGRRPKGGAAIEGIPSIGAENVNGLGNYDYASTKYVGDDFFKQMKTGIVMDYDILLYKDGAYIGKKTMVGRGFPFYKCCVNEYVFILRAQPSIGQFYLYFYLDQPSITEQIKQLNTNSAQPGLNRESLGGLEILIPDQRLLVNFTKIAQSIIEIILNNSIENKELANIRDSLLPRLMSGKIRV